MKSEHLRLFVGLLNTLGLIAYIAWLALEGRDRLFYTQEGVLFLLPCLPIFLVYIMLLHKTPEPGEETMNMTSRK